MLHRKRVYPSSHRVPIVSLFLLLISVSNAISTAHQKFREAPKFYNSLTCPSVSAEDPCSASAVHVVMTLDSRYLRGSMATIFSILQHSDCPENIRFHFITSSSSSSYLISTIMTSFPYLHSQGYPFSSSSVSGHISTSIRPALDVPLNYARNYIPYILPTCVQKVTYLDSDVILVDDIYKLFSHPISGDAVLAAPEYCSANFTSYFTPTFWSNPSLSSTFSGRKPCYFNTGVMVIDMAKWRAGDYTTQIVEWMELQKRIRIYELGSLPPFLLVFAGKIAAIDHRWNKHGLGGDNFRGLCRDLHPGPISLLHWSGKGKPWVRIDDQRACPIDALWVPYDLMRTKETTLSF